MIKDQTNVYYKANKKKIGIVFKYWPDIEYLSSFRLKYFPMTFAFVLYNIFNQMPFNIEFTIEFFFFAEKKNRNWFNQFPSSFKDDLKVISALFRFILQAVWFGWLVVWFSVFRRETLKLRRSQVIFFEVLIVCYKHQLENKMIEKNYLVLKTLKRKNHLIFFSFFHLVFFFR